MYLVSSYLKPGKNLIAMKVFRWTDGSYMEVQDMIRWAGIYRDVFLRFDPKQHIRDIKFIGTPDVTLKKISADYSVALANCSNEALKNAKVEFELLEVGTSTSVKSWSDDINTLAGNSELKVDGNIELNDLKLWSPDLPNLYSLMVTLKDAGDKTVQVARIDAGFKRFEDINGNLHLNGKRYHIRGVNRHEHHPRYGRHVPVEDMVRDLKLMKQNNINTVRTSHYPDDERWYYLCNRYGIALIDEANVESHGFEDVPGNRPQWIAASADRVESMIQRDKNHPSVFIWSLGNEQGWGWTKAFEKQYERAKQIDASRLVMCDRANRTNKKESQFNNEVLLDKPDVVTPMYRVFENTAEYLKNRDRDKRPFFMCEYRHAMGNAVGALKEVWDHFYANEENGLNGGCIWDWIDQGVEAHDKDGTLYYQYGGDWGDKESFDNFCLNGLVLADRSWTPKLAEVKKCYEPFTVEAISLKEGTFKVKNRLNQLNMSAFNIKWLLLEDGLVIQSGRLENIDAQPSEKQLFRVPYNVSQLNADKEYFVRIGFELKEPTQWAPKGYEVTFSEFKIKGSYLYQMPSYDKVPMVIQDQDKVLVKTDDGVSLSFNKESGLLFSLKIKENELLAQSNRDRLFDNTQAWIDNLYRLKTNSLRLKDFKKLDLENIVRQGKAGILVEEKERCIVVTIKNLFMSNKNAGYKEVQTWTINGNGQIELAESVIPVGKLTTEVWIPRIGLRFPLKPELSLVNYYGLGPHGNYPDRCYGAWTGIHKMRVADSYIAYPYPQDCGNREQVRWMSISASNGLCLNVIASKPLSMSVLPFTQDELQAAKHTIDLPKKSKTTELRVATKVTGIGNGSCGPLTDEQYRPKAEKTQFKLVLTPFYGK